MNKMQKKSIIVQIALVVVAVMLGIVSIFNNNFTMFFEISLGFLLFVLAYNNEIIFKRKGLTYIYIIAGIILITMIVLGMINDVVRIY